MPDNADSFLPPIPTITPANTPYVLCSSCAAAPVTLIEQWLVPVAICVALAEANSDGIARQHHGTARDRRPDDDYASDSDNCTLAYFTEAGYGPEDQLPFELYSFEDCGEWLHPVFGEGAGPAIISSTWAPTWMVPNRRTALTATTPLLPQRTTVVVLLVRSWTVRWTPCWDSIRPHS